jgi:hypothetical protein
MKILILLLIGAEVVFGYSGCTAIGFGVGAIIDSQKADYDTIPGWYSTSIWRGEDIRVTKKTGEELNGKYLGLETLADSQYAPLYNECRDKYKKEISLPALGDSISIVTRESGKEYKGEFLGFDAQYIWVNTRMWRPNRQQVDMGKVDRITDQNNNLIDVKGLRDLSSEGEIPALSTVALKTNSETLHIPTAEVDQMVAPADKNAKWNGLAVGVAIDITIGAIIAATAPRGLKHR